MPIEGETFIKEVLTHPVTLYALELCIVYTAKLAGVGASTGRSRVSFLNKLGYRYEE